ncbi:MAG: acyclic terpene utilization AtuA family protein [Rhodobacteraceae bacterium]|nr:acyclic terpene utilization AtuA family protein [Paracoccaceae bacterium]
MPTQVLVPAGVLGLKFDRRALARGLDRQPDIIAIDGGSTDSGPYYLGASVSKYSRAVTRAEWTELMIARNRNRIPLVLTTAGTCGTDACVDWMLEITREVAHDLGQTLRVATIKSSQDNTKVAQNLDHGRIHELADAPSIDRETLLACDNIVALAGTEQVSAALSTDSDIIITGRATDTAAIAALPLMRGAHPGAAWHGAKIAECGALCSTRPLTGVISVNFDSDGFEVEAMADNAHCTPHSVSAHMLYENADPFQLAEPGGVLDVSKAKYTALDAGRVRVRGSVWRPSDRYCVKLEGARFTGYQTSILTILRQERYVTRAAEWVKKLENFLHAEIDGIDNPDIHLEFRLIGANAALGQLERCRATGCEVGVLCLVTAPAQETANQIAKLINPYLLHFPLSEDESLPTFAFPYSPAESERGQIYEFCLQHVMELDHPLDAFRLETHEIGRATSR